MDLNKLSRIADSRIQDYSEKDVDRMVDLLSSVNTERKARSMAKSIKSADKLLERVKALPEAIRKLNYDIVLIVDDVADAFAARMSELDSSKVDEVLEVKKESIKASKEAVQKDTDKRVSETEKFYSSENFRVIAKDLESSLREEKADVGNAKISGDDKITLSVEDRYGEVFDISFESDSKVMLPHRTLKWEIIYNPKWDKESYKGGNGSARYKNSVDESNHAVVRDILDKLDDLFNRSEKDKKSKYSINENWRSE